MKATLLLAALASADAQRAVFSGGAIRGPPAVDCAHAAQCAGIPSRRPNVVCADGSMGGPVCADVSGVCTWTIRQCPGTAPPAPAPPSNMHTVVNSQGQTITVGTATSVHHTMSIADRLAQQNSVGGRCASGFCEDQNNCPQCAAGLSCSVPAGMMCAGTCYGTCAAPAAAETGTFAACIARNQCENICTDLPADDFCLVNGACAPGAPPGCATAATCSDMQIRPSCAELQQSYTCDTDMSRLTGGDPHYTGQTLSDYCQLTCGVCTGGAGHGAGSAVSADMLSDSAYPYPSTLRTPLAPAAVPAGNPACWGGEYTSARCCVNGGDSTCWSGQFNFAFCCAAGGH